MKECKVFLDGIYLVFKCGDKEVRLSLAKIDHYRVSKEAGEKKKYKHFNPNVNWIVVAIGDKDVVIEKDGKIGLGRPEEMKEALEIIESFVSKAKKYLGVK